MKRVIFLVSIFFCTRALATDQSVFGFTLGKPISIPACTKADLDIEPPDYKQHRLSPCFQNLVDRDSQSPTPNGFVRLFFAAGETPGVIQGQFVSAMTMDGIVEMYMFDTIPRETDTIFQKLTAKYGKPTSSSSTKLQNGFGATFDSSTWTWNLPDLFVTFVSRANAVDRGLVSVETRKAHDKIDSEAGTRVNSGPPL